MTYDLVDDSGEVLFSGYPLSDAKAEQSWRVRTNQSSVSIVEHGKAKTHRQSYSFCSLPPPSDLFYP